MKKVIAALVLINMLFLTGSTGFTSGEGSWIGSGGEIFNYSKNPWFLKNTSQVTYCIEHSQSSTSATTDDLRSAVSFAIKYWQAELYQKPGSNTLGELLLATQSFNEIACPDYDSDEDKPAQVDIRIKFGYETLTSKEINWLKNPQRYIGVTVRQRYDTEILHGQGFIFIASDLGLNSYNNNSGKLISKAWENKQLLNYVLVHEFGHVFGVPHTGSGLMSETFFDELLSKRMAPFYSSHPVMRFLSAPQDGEVCKGTSNNGEFSSNFFKVDGNTECIKIVESKPGAELALLAKNKNSTEYLTIGKIILTTPSARKFGMRPAVLLQVPPEQKVFAGSEIPFGSFLVGPLFIDIDFQGVFKFPDSEKSYPVSVDLRSDSVSVKALVSNRIEPVFTYLQPSLLRMLVPIEEQ